MRNLHKYERELALHLTIACTDVPSQNKNCYIFAAFNSPEMGLNHPIEILCAQLFLQVENLREKINNFVSLHTTVTLTRYYSFL